MDIAEVKLLGFDVFGTVVDWRGSVARHAQGFFKAEGISVDPFQFATDWRSLYQPSMEKIRSGARAWVPLSVLNLENLKLTLAYHGLDVDRFTPKSLKEFNRAWERLDPWPDSVDAIARLKRQYAVTTISNGNIAGMMWLAKYADLRWDAILGSEIAQNYKPRPEVYFRSAEVAGLSISETGMVAAHNDDLEAASNCGMKTLFVFRRKEHGEGQITDLMPEKDWDLVAEDLKDLADQLGC
ncbi:HAD-IA family hydrolase [Rhizobium aegyptiacum]|uniref:HAD-IA family hydrolase n=1 Tax=Rhizobium aegyptiacum TaxID=1764550 RepID=UPI0007E54875|nr:HAD-IA family hydrolase [Rhizobium aegyptiacum]